jgi:hypothetical protein
VACAADGEKYRIRGTDLARGSRKHDRRQKQREYLFESLHDAMLASYALLVEALRYHNG